MNREQRENAAQRWMEALAQYANAEPGPGMQNRILARLSTEQQKPGVYSLFAFNFRALALAATAALLAVAAVVVVSRGLTHEIANRRPPATAQPIGRSMGNSVVAALSVPQQPTVSCARHVAKVDKTRSLRQSTSATEKPSARFTRPTNVFPTPVPPSEQEKLLRRYLRGTPQEELIAIARDAAGFAERAREREAELTKD